MVNYDKISNRQANLMIKNIFEARSKRDSRGLIQAKDLYRAIRSTYGGHGKLDNNVIHGAINQLVHNGFLSFKKFDDGHLQFFITFTDLVKDESGAVIGVRHTPKRWWEA